MLTARGEEVDRIVGLELGADDYVVKPFSAGELVARIRAIQRRGRAPTAGGRRSRSARSPWIRPRAHVTKDGEPIELAAKEFDLLKLLMSRAGEVVGREEIMDEVWDPHWFGPDEDARRPHLVAPEEDRGRASRSRRTSRPSGASGSVSLSRRMKVRARLVASFAYVLLVVIVASHVPLADRAARSARSELEALTPTTAQTATLQDAQTGWPSDDLALLGDPAGSRATPSGMPRRRGARRRRRCRRDRARRLRRRGRRQNFATAGRPEVAQALRGGRAPRCAGATRRAVTSRWGRRRSSTRVLVGAVRISRGVRTVQENVGRAPPADRRRSARRLGRRPRPRGRLSRSIARPMTRLAATAHRFGEGDLAAPRGPIEGRRRGRGPAPLVRRDGRAPERRSARSVSSWRTPPTSSGPRSPG